MNETLKQAFEEGKQRAATELDQKIKDAVKKREALVGWKEHAQPPARLSEVGK